MKLSEVLYFGFFLFPLRLHEVYINYFPSLNLTLVLNVFNWWMMQFTEFCEIDFVLFCALSICLLNFVPRLPFATPGPSMQMYDLPASSSYCW